MCDREGPNRTLSTHPMSDEEVNHKATEQDVLPTLVPSFPPTLTGVYELDYIIISYISLNTLIRTFSARDGRRSTLLAPLGHFLGGGRDRETSLRVLHMFNTILMRRLGVMVPIWLATESSRIKPDWATEKEWFDLNVQPYNDILTADTIMVDLGSNVASLPPGSDYGVLDLFEPSVRLADRIVPSYAVDTIPLLRQATARLAANRACRDGGKYHYTESDIGGFCHYLYVDAYLWAVICTLARACGADNAYPPPIYAVLTDLIAPYMSMKRIHDGGVFAGRGQDKNDFDRFVRDSCLPQVTEYHGCGDRSALLAWVSHPEVLRYIVSNVTMWFLTSNLRYKGLPTLLPAEQDVFIDAILTNEYARGVLEYSYHMFDARPYLGAAGLAGLTHRVDGMNRVLEVMGSAWRR